VAILHGTPEIPDLAGISALPRALASCNRWQSGRFPNRFCQFFPDELCDGRLGGTSRIGRPRDSTMIAAPKNAPTG
jgi:hypothetical protein